MQHEHSIEQRRLKDLKANNPYLRMGTDVKDLEKSIRTIGLIAPLVVSKSNVILAGARRYQALLNLGFIEAPVIVIDKDELELELISIDENLVRKDLDKIELEGHLRRAKEIYEALHPHEFNLQLETKKNFAKELEKEIEEMREEEKRKPNTQLLPGEKFLNLVAEKTGLSPKQIHEAINRDEKATTLVKTARKNGELSLSQTNEIIKLSKEEQQKSLPHLKNLPVREIKAFIKKTKAEGVEKAIKEIPKNPHAREFTEIESLLARLTKKLKQLDLEGIEIDHFPVKTKELFNHVAHYILQSDLIISNENKHSEERYQH